MVLLTLPSPHFSEEVPKPPKSTFARTAKCVLSKVPQRLKKNNYAQLTIGTEKPIMFTIISYILIFIFKPELKTMGKLRTSIFTMIQT